MICCFLAVSKNQVTLWNQQFYKSAKWAESVIDSIAQPIHLEDSGWYQSISHHCVEHEPLSRRVFYKTLSIPLDTFKKVANPPQIYLFGSPEQSAVTVGRLMPSSSDSLQYRFQLPRFHTGVPAQLDLETAIEQMFAFSKIKKLLGSKKLISKQNYVISLIREGHLTSVQQAIWHSSRSNVPTTLVHVRHKQVTESKTPLARMAVACDFNLEGIEVKNINNLIISDNVASGIQVGVTALSVLSHLNGVGKSLKRVIFVTPLLTDYSVLVLSHLLAQYGLSCTFLVSGGLLTNRDSQRYYSPLSHNPDYLAEPAVAAIHHLAHPKKIRQMACVRCNWTASFLAPKQALVDSQAELTSLGSSNRQLQTHSNQIGLDQLKEAGVKVESLLPLSSLIGLSQ